MEGNALVVLRRIVAHRKPIGMIYIRSDSSEMRQRLRSYALIVFGVLAVSFALALAVSSALQKKIAAPLLALSDTARTIATKHDYSVRALTGSSDEIGTLSLAFNDMLQQIEEQTATLQRAEAAVREVNADLERHVMERTEKLTIANAELANAESTLRDRAVALEAANSELESFSYSVSHDLRSPLRAIDGYARIFEEDYKATLDDEGRRLLSVIRSEARRMGILIDDLLAFSQLGRKSLNLRAVDLGRMAGEIVSEKRRRYPNKEINFVAGDMPKALADSGAIRHVVFNLIANAVRYAKRDQPVHIEVGGRTDGDRNLYWVSDRGIGFDMRYAEKIFGVFQRLHSNAEIEGTGVGLAIVQRIVERHGGRVWAESEIGKGSTFFFTLPLVEDGIEHPEVANERSGNSAGRG